MVPLRCYCMPSTFCLRVCVHVPAGKSMMACILYAYLCLRLSCLPYLHSSQSCTSHCYMTREGAASVTISSRRSLSCRYAACKALREWRKLAWRACSSFSWCAASASFCACTYTPHNTTCHTRSSPKPATCIGPAKLLQAIALSIQLSIPLLSMELGTVTAWRALYCAICIA